MLNHAYKEARQKGNHERSILFVINMPPQGFLLYHSTTKGSPNRPRTTWPIPAKSILPCSTLTRPKCRQMAYFLVHSLAVASYLARSVLYTCAISGTRGSSGFGSVSIEQMERRTFDMVSAGLHWSRKMSKHMLPLELILG